MKNQELNNLKSNNKQQLTSLLEFSLFEKKFENSLEILNKLISLDNNNVGTYQLRAKVHMALRMFQQAIEDAKKVKQLSQKVNLEIQNILITAYLEIGENKIAQQTIKQTIQTDQSLREFIHLTQTLKKIQNDQQYILPPKQQKIINQMKDWLQKAGSSFEKVKVVNQTKSYRGAIATKSIKVFASSLSLERLKLITLEQAKLNSISTEIIQNYVELLSPKHCFMSILLLEQKAKGLNSKWKLYIDILPEDHSCFPINYSSEQLHELIGSAFIYQIKEKVMDLKKDYDQICVFSKKFASSYSFKDFCWARMMVGSRVFGVIIDGVKTQILAPYADMLNHKIPKQTVWNYSQQKKGFFIQSLKEINIGEQLFDSYGKKCNSRFLLNYGFVTQNNDRNQICIKIEFNQNDPTLQKKLQMLQQTQITPKIFRITKFIEENNFFQMMGFLRFKHIDRPQALNLLIKISQIEKTQDAYKPSRTPPTTMQIEIKIWKQLLLLCQQQIQLYPTTLQQDQQLILSRDISQNIRNILTLRMGQKRIFKKYIDTAKNAIQILSKGYQQALQYSQKQLQIDYCFYIEKILKLMPHKKNRLLKKDNFNIETNLQKNVQSKQQQGFSEQTMLQ